jgi:signal peptidase
LNIKRISSWIIAAFLVALLLLVGFLVFGPWFGWETHSVLSGSMEPSLKVGGIIVAKPEKLENIKVGDIITFQLGNKTVTHRVADITRDDSGRIWFQTKGDANESPDPEAVSSDKEVVRKVVLHIPYLGFVSSVAKSKALFLVSVCVLTFFILFFIAKEIKRRMKEETESA